MKTKPTMGRKLIAWILTLAMVITFIPMTGNAAYAGSTSSMTLDRANATYELGEPIIVTATTSDAGAWVGLYCSSNNDQTCTWDYIHSKGKNGKAFNILTDYDTWNHGPSTGNGSVYLEASDGNVTIPVTLTECTHEKSVSVDEDTCNAESKLKVNVVSSGTSDWVAVYKGTHTVETDYSELSYVGAYSYTYGYNHSSIELGYLEAGDYTVALLKDDGYVAADVDNFTVAESDGPELPSVPTVATDKATYKYGEPIFVTTTSTYGYSNTDWVGIYQKGQAPGNAMPSISWYYIKDYKDGFDITDFANSHDKAVPAQQQDALFNGKLKAGEYTVYMCLNDSYTVETQTDITIEKEPYGEPEVTPAGCEIAGSSVQWYTDGSKEETTIAALEHNWSDYVYDAETKTHSRTCSTTEHDAETGDCEFEVSGEPVVDASGTTTTYKCSTCGGTYTETVASGFAFVENVTVEPTCTTDGETYELWANETTGETKKVNVVVLPATNHKWGDWTPVDESATTHERVCANDSEHKETGDCNRNTTGFQENKTVKLCDVCGGGESEVVLSMEKEIYGVGEDIIVKTNFPKDTKNWIGIFYSTDGIPYPNAPAKGWKYLESNTDEVKVNDKTIWAGGAADKDIFLLDNGEMMPGEWTVAIILNDASAEGQVVPYLRFTVCDHKWTGEKVIETATCVKEGLKEFTCSTCKEKKTEVIPTLEHSWGAPTFSENQAIYGCDNCDAEKTVAALTMEKEVYGVGEDIIVKTNFPKDTNNWIGIFYSTDGTPYPDAPAKGWKYLESDSDELKINDKTIWAGGAADKDTFLLADGKMMPGEWTVAIILNDASAEGQVVPLLRFTVCDHNWNTENIVNNATCTEEGLKELICKCGDKKTEVIPKLGHSYDEGTVTEEPTCTEAGVKTFVCQKDATHTYTEPVAALGHDMTFTDATEPTCDVAGNNPYYSCGTCEKLFEDEAGEYETNEESIVIPATGTHDLTAVEEVAATCETEGTAAHSVCGTCEGLFVAEGDAWVKVTAADLVIDALGHNYVGTVTTEPTCTEEGVKTFVCQNDAKHTYPEAIPATGHVELTKTGAVAATCEKDGNIEYFTCKCGKLFADKDAAKEITAKDAVVAKLGHKWDAGKVTKEATCTEEGVKTFVCQNDAKHTRTEAVAATGHTYTAVVTDPTCTEGGFTTFTCACGHSYKDAVTEALGHTVVVDKAVAPTYKATGLTEGSHCDVCGVVLEAQEEVAGLVPAAAKNVKVNLRTLSGGYDDIKVTWNKVTGATGYKVFYKKKAAQKWNVANVKTNSFVKANLAAGTIYQVKVVAVGKFGESKVSGTFNVTTLKKLNAPKVTKSGTKVKVKWNNINGETGYQISRALKKGGTNVIATVKTTTGVSKVVKANKGKKYFYKVRAYKVVNGTKVFGPWSNVKAFTR